VVHWKVHFQFFRLERRKDFIHSIVYE